MATIAEKIQSGFELARQINEAVWMDGRDSQQLSVDELCDYVGQEFSVNITIQVLDVETKAVLGFIMRYEEGRRACVYIVKNTPIRWKRLVGVKELCHVVVDTEEDFNPNGVDTLQRMMSLVADMDAIENLALRSEHIAEMVALELIYPHEDRRAHMDAIGRGEATFADIGTRYRLPEIIIQMILTPAYLAMCDKYWRAVDEARRAKVVALRAAANEG
ncbi:MAG: hypothetical protein V7672_11860 [Brevundimonas sp.]|uniref:hypothetical protein n=1 Tax=Brevundimonas sp. TaxID=1871086 RepID=UPI0030016EC1